jgi:hypothetical protein
MSTPEPTDGSLSGQIGPPILSDSLTCGGLPAEGATISITLGPVLRYSSGERDRQGHRCRLSFQL